MAIWNLAWPQILMMFLFFCVGFTDVWAAGRISAGVQAAFGLISQCITFLLVVSMAASSGAMATISQSIGAGRMARARRYVALITMGGFVAGIVVAMLALALEGPLLAILMIPKDIEPIAVTILHISLYTLPANYMLATTGVIFRATRYVLPPVLVVGVVFTANLIGNLGFGLGYFGLPAYGYVGLAWSTFVSVAIGAALNCFFLARKGWLNKEDIPGWRWIRIGSVYLYKVALPAGASHIMWHTGYLLLFVIAASLPYDSVNALAGLTAGMRVEALLFLPGLAFNMTVSVLVGNYLGAGQREEAKSIAVKITALGVGCMSVVAIFLWPFISNLAAVLSDVPAAIGYTESYLRYNLVSTPFSACSMILGGVMVGAGATRYNLRVFGTCFWLVRLPVAWIFGHYIWRDASGIFMAMLVSQIFQSALMLWVLFRIDWTCFSMYHHQSSCKESSS